jgi:hypothetical protein
MELAMGASRDSPYSDSDTGEKRRHHLHETVIKRAVCQTAIATSIRGLGVRSPLDR